MLSELEFFWIYAGSISTLKLALSYLFRFDRNHNGKIDPNEVEFLKNTKDMEVKMEAPYYDELSIMSFIRVGIEAMLHSFCYGCLVVFSMNLVMYKWNTGDGRFTYLLTCLMIHMACLCMCKYATNGIHVATSHNIHLAYYGFSTIPLVFLWTTPDREYLIAVAAILLLFIDRISRSISMPDFPTHYEICRIYKLEAASGKWLPLSEPKVDSLVMTDSVSESPSMPKSCIGDLEKLAVAFPVYEIMNVHISSSFTIGVLCGVAASMFVGHSGVFNTGVASNESLIISVLVAAVVVLITKSFTFGSAENKMHNLTLSRYHPNIVATLSAILGAAAAVLQLEPLSDDEEANVIVFWVGVGALLVTIGLTFAISIWAKIQRNRSVFDTAPVKVVNGGEGEEAMLVPKTTEAKV